MVDSIFTKSHDTGYSQSIFNKVIPFDEVFTFNVKLISAPKRDVCIGVVDYEKHKNVSRFCDSNIAVGYHSKNAN